jgi:hypothetical protein
MIENVSTTINKLREIASKVPRRPIHGPRKNHQEYRRHADLRRRRGTQAIQKSLAASRPSIRARRTTTSADHEIGLPLHRE